MKLNKVYITAYANPVSTAFVQIAQEIESALLTLLNNRTSDVMGVQVTKVTNGSALIDFIVISNSYSQTASVIQTLISYAIKSGDLKNIHPDPASNLTAKGLFYFVYTF